MKRGPSNFRELPGSAGIPAGESRFQVAGKDARAPRFIESLLYGLSWLGTKNQEGLRLRERLRVRAWFGLTCIFLTFTSLADAGTIDESKLPPPAKTNILFDRDIKPILEANCLRCHGPEKPRSHFQLLTRELALKGGDNGVDIIPGDSAKSPIIHYTARLVPDMEMPPEGKGEPLKPEQVSLLRAWIDQGALWGATNPPTQFASSATPLVRGIWVDGDTHKFREIEGVKEGAGGGLEDFSLEEKIGTDKKVTITGHAIFPEDNILIKANLDQADFGFVHGGFQEWRKYYDDTGGYYQPFAQPSFDLGKDLHLDIGRAWADFGLTLPRWPQIVLGYEYQFRRGSKSTLEWGNVNGKNIYPAYEDIQEHTHIAKLDMSYDAFGWLLQDSARVEIYELQSVHYDVLNYTLGPFPDSTVQTSQDNTHVQGMNTFRLEKQVADWWLLSAGYLYSKFSGDSTMNQITTDAQGLPAPGNFWSSDPIELDRESQVVSASSMFQPVKQVTFSVAAQGEWQDQSGYGNVYLDQGDPYLPQFFQLAPASVRSDLETTRASENGVVRYTGIPFTTLFGDARFDQEDTRQREMDTYYTPDLIQDTDAINSHYDWRAGFNTSPWRWIELSAHYRGTYSDTVYNHVKTAQTPEGYSAFIDQRRIQGDEVEAKLVLRPAMWLKTTFAYHYGLDAFWTDTEPVSGGISPGGNILAGNSDANVYSVAATFVPAQKFSITATFAYTDSRLWTAQNADPSIVPYKGNIYSVLATAMYAFNSKTSLHGTYSFSQADYGQGNVADGLPLGLNYTHNALIVGLTRQVSKLVSASLRYGFYQYLEPSTGGFNDYTANGVFATVRVKWP